MAFPTHTTKKSQPITALGDCGMVKFAKTYAQQIAAGKLILWYQHFANFRHVLGIHLKEFVDDTTHFGAR